MPTATPGTNAGVAPVLISEIMYDPLQTGNDAQYEWVELYNSGETPVAMNGWHIRDNNGSDVIPQAIIPARGYLVLAASLDFDANYPDLKGNVVFTADGSVGNGLANTGDRISLLDDRGRYADAVSYGSDYSINNPPLPTVQPGHSLERLGTGASFRDNASPSPGAGYVPPAPSPTPSPEPVPTPTLAPTATYTPTPSPTGPPATNTPTLAPATISVAITPGAPSLAVDNRLVAPSPAVTPTSSAPNTNDASSSVSRAGTSLRAAAIALVVLFVGVAAWRMKGRNKGKD